MLRNKGEEGEKEKTLKLECQKRGKRNTLRVETNSLLEEQKNESNTMQKPSKEN